MHKTEGLNHTNNLFVNGPPGTRVEENWLNAVQNEIRNAIEDAGLVLKTATTETGNQLSAAITLLAIAATPAAPGLVVRPKFIWKDADEIYISAGSYDHRGTVNQIVYWASQLTYQFTALAASDWSYLYLDDSAIVALGTNLLTTAELVDSVTEPAWNEAKGGWYNGDDRCIMAVRTSGASAILEFFHDGSEAFIYADRIEDLASTAIGVGWTDVTLTIPKFSIEALINTTTNSAGATKAGILSYWRTNGQAAGTGHQIGQTHDSVWSYDTGQARVITDSSQKIEVVTNQAVGSEIRVASDAYIFPAGM